MRVSVRQTWPYLSVYNNGDDGKSIYEYIGIDETPSAFPVWTSDLKETIRKKSCIRETQNLLTGADSSNNTITSIKKCHVSYLKCHMSPATLNLSLSGDSSPNTINSTIFFK